MHTYSGLKVILFIEGQREGYLPKASIPEDYDCCCSASSVDLIPLLFFLLRIAAIQAAPTQLQQILPVRCYRM